MANVLKIKRGSSVPSSSDLAVYELGYRTGTTELYINDNGTYRQLGGSSSGAVDSIANFADNRVLTASDADSINGEANLTFDGGLLSVTRDNGIAQTTVLSLKAYDSDGDQTASLTADLDFHLWDSNTQLSTPQARIGIIGNSTGTQNAESGGILAFYTNIANYSSPSLTERMRIDEEGDVTIQGGSLILPATEKLYLDGSNNQTYLVESSNDVLDIYAGGTNMLRLEESGTDYVQVFDNTRLTVGTGKDLELWHDASNTYIRNNTGDLYISNDADDKDVILRSDDGSGNQTAYLTLDGSSTRIKIDQNMEFQDSVALKFGTSDDMRIYHDGSNSYIRQEGTGHLYIRNDTEDKSIFIQTDDGSGGTTDYMKFSGNESIIRTYKNFRLQDSVQVQFGSDSDLRIQHDGTNSWIYNNVSGHLYIENRVDDKDVIFRCDDGAGGLTGYLELDGSAKQIKLKEDIVVTATKKLYLDGGSDCYIHNPSGDTIDFIAGGQQMLRMYEGGTDYVHTDDNVRLGVGNDPDVYMYHDATNSHFVNTTGNLTIVNTANDGDILFQSDDGSGSTATYIQIDGGATITKFDKATRHDDSVTAYFGGGLDGRIYHNGSNFYIANTTTGDMYIQNELDDKDIILRSDDGSGGVTPYLTLDGSAESINVSKKLLVEDSVWVALGNSSDAALYHDDSNAYFRSWKGSIFITTETDDQDIVLSSDNGSGGTTQYIRIDGSAGLTQIDKDMKFVDNVEAQFGSSTDMKIYHDAGGNSYIENNEEHLIIVNNEDDHDIYLKSDNGSGGTANYLVLDGSEVATYAYKPIRIKTTSSSAEIRLYNEDGTGQIADTFSDTTTDKSYIYFYAGDSSNDPGYIMHETSDSETNEGVLHLCPSDDNADADYISIHGTNDADSLKLATSGRISGATMDAHTWDGHITWNTGKNINVAGESSFDVSGSGVWQVWDSGDGTHAIKMDVGEQVEIGNAGSRGLRVHGKCVTANNSGYVQYDNAGNQATVLNQDTSDILKVGDATHTEQIKIMTANHNASNGGIHLTSGGVMSFNGNATFSSPMTVNYGAVFNEGSNDSDFRVESNGNTHALFVDAGNNKVGILDSSPEYTLKVAGDIGFDADKAIYRGGQRHTIGSYNSSAQTGRWQPIIASVRNSGRMIHYDEDFQNGSNSVNAYNNAGGGHVTCTRVTASSESLDAPNSSGYVMKIVSAGSAASPGYGGFYQLFTSEASHTFVQIFQAKVPSGYTLNIAENARGNNATSYWLSPNVGTGQWEWYCRVANSGNGGTFGTSGHVYLSGGTDESHTWYLASCTAYDVSESPGGYTSSDGIYGSPYGLDLNLRRGGNDDDKIEIEASETKIWGDSVERVRFGSYGIRNNYGGSAGTPSYSFISDTNTGIYSSGADSFNITTGGTERTQINSLGVKVVNGALGVDVTPNGTDGRIDASNDVVAYSTSDKRLKENIKPLDNALDKVMQISGVEFDWKKLTEKEKKTIHGNQGHDVGVIAQEIEEVLPEVVTQRDSGYKAVKYEKIVPLLIEAIKEQQKQIQELKNG